MPPHHLGETFSEVMNLRKNQLTSIGLLLIVVSSLAGCGVGVKAAKNGGGSAPLKVLAFWASDSTTPLTDLYTHPHAVTNIAPFWYSLNATGSLTSKVDSTILANARKNHIAITPLVNDATGTQAFLTTRIRRVTAARNIADMVRKMHYQGVNIDFEPPHTSLAKQLSGFMVDLRDFLPHTDKITIDIVPHSGGAYDYSALSHEVNQFVLMSYDEHDDGSAEGPVAAMPWVTNIVKRLMSSVPASKIDLGVALYGYQWPDGSTHAKTIPYNAITPVMIQNAKWSASAQEDYAPYNISSAAYISWWESLQSMSQKIALAKKDHLAGIALWHIGYANNAVMQLLLHRVGKQP